jgi:inosine-uridine nucleoside N-ribohydrolase
MSISDREAAFRSKIPFQRGTEEYKLYEKLIPALGNPRNLLVITDIEQDRDDLLAVLILVHMHHLGIVNLVGFIANHRPSEKRAKLLRTILHLQGLPDMPVAAGTDGTSGREKRDLFWHELRNQTFEHQDWNKDKKQLCGYNLIESAFKQVGDQKLAVLCLSSLQDLSEYFNKQDDQFIRKGLATVVSQGGYEIQEGLIKPDLTAMNNRFNPEAAESITNRLNELNISSDAWGKEVAVAAAVDRTFLKGLRGPVGDHLRWVSDHQDFKFWWDAFNKPFMPHLNGDWFKKICLGIEVDSEEFRGMRNQPLSFQKAMQFGTFPAYDACAAMGALGDHVLQCLGILSMPLDVSNSQTHRMFGKSRDDLGGINAANLKSAMEAFIKGSLRATQELAEKMIPSDSIHYSTPSYNVTWEIFQQQMPHLQKLEAFKQTKGIKDEDVERFSKEMFGDNKLLDDSGKPVKDLDGKDCPMIPTTIPYEDLYQFEVAK